MTKNGMTALITGSTDGIGRQTALELLQRGAEVILHGRNPGRVAATHAELLAAVPGGVLHSFVADLSSLAAVRNLAASIRSSVPHLNILINNAGTYMKERRLTADGYETTFAVNHLAHFLLTTELLDLLRRSAPARIITVSSVAHTRGALDFDNLQSERHFDPYASYAQSKLANVLFSHELARRTEGSGVTSNSLHPGVIATKLLRIGFNIEGGSLERGASTSVYLATAPEVAQVSGKYFAKSAAADPSPLAYDAALRRRLWDVSEDLVRRFRVD